MNTDYKIINDYVLIKLDIKYEDLISMHRKTKSGLLIDASYSQSDYVPRRGEVISVCDKLIYDKKNIFNGSMLWKTDIEVKPGDIVIGQYLNILMALGEYGNPTYDKKQANTYVNLNGEVGIFLKYSHLVLAIRKGEIIMLNGRILVEPDNINLSTDKLYVPEQLSKTKGTIRYLGSLNKEYAYDKTDDLYPYAVGDKIQFKHNNAIYVEGWNDGVLEKNYYYMQRKDITKIYV